MLRCLGATISILCLEGVRQEKTTVENPQPVDTKSGRFDQHFGSCLKGVFQKEKDIYIPS